jgi:hypothetical protein
MSLKIFKTFFRGTRDIIVKATKKNYLIRKRACLERTFESRRRKLIYLKVPAIKRKENPSV